VIFSLLKDLLSVMPEIWIHREKIDLDFLCKNSRDNKQILKDAIQASGLLPILLQGLDQYKSGPTFDRYIKHWFDAFRTLKFIHYLRDNHFPSVPLKEILTAPFITNINTKLQDSMFDLAAQNQNPNPQEMTSL
jgi:hypothetical protein